MGPCMGKQTSIAQASWRGLAGVGGRLGLLPEEAGAGLL